MTVAIIIVVAIALFAIETIVHPPKNGGHDE